MPGRDRRVLDLMREVASVVAPVGSGTVERKGHDVEVLALFDRCRSLHGAVHLLLAQGFGHEAVMLGRPLFLDSLALAEFAAVDEKRRGSLVVGWWLASLQDLEGYCFEQRTLGRDVTDDLAGIARQRGEIEQYAAANGYSTKHWRPDGDPKRLADKHERRDELSSLLVAHMFVHGATVATSDRYAHAEHGAVVGGPTTDESLKRDAGLFASHSMLYATRAACRIFGWPEPARLDELLATIRGEASDRQAGGKG